MTDGRSAALSLAPLPLRTLMLPLSTSIYCSLRYSLSIVQLVCVGERNICGRLFIRELKFNSGTLKLRSKKPTVVSVVGPLTVVACIGKGNW